MALYRVQCRFPYFSGAPEDLSTNTFYFLGPVGSSVAQDAADIQAKLNVFWQAIDGFLSPVLTNTMTWKAYDMSDPEPRVPKFQNSVTLTVGATGTGLPEEVAAVLSFQAAPASGVPQARRRGRIYIGPLSTSILGLGNSAGFCQILATARTTITAAASAMCSTVSNPMQWHVYSATNGTSFRVANGWMDIQPDVQRRRGHEVAGRTLWTATA